MGRALKLNRKKIAQIQAARRSGLSYARCAAVCGVSVGSVGNALRAREERPPPNLPPITDEEPPKATPKDAPAVDPNATPEEQILAILRRTLFDLDQQAAIQYKARNMPAYNSLVTRINQTTTSLMKLTPRGSDDPNEQPDMIAAAALGRAKIHTILDRLYAAREETAADEEKTG